MLNTLIGAGVGVAFNLLYPPALPTRRASRAIIDVADATAAPLDAASQALAKGPINREQVQDWLDRVHAGSLRLKSATETVTSLKDSRRLNPRALGTTDIEPVLASGLRTLESCLLAIRALFTVVLAELPTEDRPDDPYGEELRAAFAVVLHDAADCIRAFGSLVLAEVEEHEEEAERSLDESLDILRETQAVLSELMTVNSAGEQVFLAAARVNPGGGRACARRTQSRRSRSRPPAVEERAADQATLPAATDSPSGSAAPRPTVAARAPARHNLAPCVRQADQRSKIVVNDDRSH